MAQWFSYCDAIAQEQFSELHKTYHDQWYGFPVTDDDSLFGRLIMEINQAGLSWDTVLRKQSTIRTAYANFKIDEIAAFTEADIEQLLQNPGIIRMRKKIEAIIYNAKQLQGLQKAHGSFYQWLCHQHPKTPEAWVKCFRKTFRFTGNEITKEFLMSTGFLPGAHNKDCPIYLEIIKAKPKWLEV